MKRHLPMLAERVLADVKALQAQVGSAFENDLRQRDVEVSCHKGCSNCCHHPFLVTVAEGVLLYRWLAAHGRWTSAMKQRVEAARHKTLGLSFQVWLLSNIPCPLLEDRQCSAYAARPTHCRTTFSVGDPTLCHPHALDRALGFVSNLKVIQEFTAEVQTSLKKLGAHGPLMPLAEALLLGEAIDTNRLPIEDSTTQHLRDLNRE